MASTYMRADGTAASKAAATGPVTNAAACMSMATHNSTGTGALTAGDVVILSDRGGDYTAGLVPQWDGVTYQAAEGESPKIRTSVKIAAGATWTDRGGGVYSASVASSIPNGNGCWVGGTTILVKGTSAALAAGQFWPDTTGNLLYVRLAGDANPAASDIYLGTTAPGIAVVSVKTGLVFDGIKFWHGDDSGSYNAAYLRVNGVTVRNCEFAYTTRPVRLYQPSGAILFQDCSFHHFDNGLAYATGIAPNTLQVDAGGTPTSYTFERCQFYDSYRGPYLVPFSGAPLYMRCCLIYGNHINGLELGGDASNRHFIHRCLIHHKPNPARIADNGHGLVAREGSTINTEVQGCLFIFEENGVVGSELVQIDRPRAGVAAFTYLKFDYNHYWAVGTPAQIFYDGYEVKNTLAAHQSWLAASGYAGADAHSTWGDPLTRDLAGRDFRPTPASPTRNAGVALAGLTTDFLGRAVPNGPAPDIGPYELYVQYLMLEVAV